MREINCITLDLTTHCNLRCKDCCAGIGINRVLQHHPWEYFENFAQFVYGIDRINLTGGEPTMHPQFGEFVPNFKNLFGCRLLTLSTNGWGAEKHLNILHHFDWIDVSDYGTNKSELVKIRDAKPDGGTFGAPFTPRSRRGSGKVCFRGLSDTVAHADGRFFGCCVGPGINDAPSIQPSKYWRQEVVDLPLPCADCWFSE